MLELGPGANVLRGLGWLYIGLNVVLVGASLWFPKRWWQKAAGVAVVLLVFTGPAYLRQHKRTQIVDERKAKYEVAKALFDERCKTAGEKIYKTVDAVEGLLLLNVRPRTNGADRADPAWPYAAHPGESSGDWYIKSFLLWEHRQSDQGPQDANRAGRSYLNAQPSPYPGYRFVDVRHDDGSLRRYRLGLPPHEANNLVHAPIASEPARFAVSFASIDTSAFRQHWIAGAKVVVIDTHSDEAIAEGIWYAFEPGLGNTNGGRTPWGFAMVCPQTGVGASPTRFFVDRVLKPKKGE